MPCPTCGAALQLPRAGATHAVQCLTCGMSISLEDSTPLRSAEHG